MDVIFFMATCVMEIYVEIYVYISVRKEYTVTHP